MINLGKPTGECVYCSATAETVKGESGSSDTLRWTLPSGKKLDQHHYTGANKVTVCPPCWDKVQAEKSQHHAARSKKRARR